MSTERRPNRLNRRTARLSTGRPPTASNLAVSGSSKTTQKLIRTHHQLRKQLTQAEANGDHVEVSRLERQLQELGGLESYQLASIRGQSNERGGDSSRVLIGWLEDVRSGISDLKPRLRLLEIGALSTKNAYSQSNLFDIERIDLQSQSKEILQQDFMERPLPTSNANKFDEISLSLVLNFVPTPQGRGAMLKRTCHFLDQSRAETLPENLQQFFPALFLVLPAACITNSRYMTEDRLTALMASLGYAMAKRKQTAKLIYYLWTLHKEADIEKQRFRKVEVNPGRGRNNFSIILNEITGTAGSCGAEP